MKCDKCGSELEGVYVGQGDKVVLTSINDDNSLVQTTYEVISSVNSDNSSLIIIAGWHNGSYYNAFHASHLSSVDGRPILGFKKDAKIAELEEQMSAALNASKKSLEQLGDAELRIKELEARLQDQIKLTLKDSLKIHNRADDLIGRGWDVKQAYVLAIRDFRDGRLK